MKIKTFIATALCVAQALCVVAKSANAQPTNVGCEPNRKAVTLDAVKDFGVESGSAEDQTPKLQAALDEISKKGGGNLIIPEGEYRLAELYMRSNTHVLVSSKAVLKPYYTPKTFNVIMVHFTPAKKETPNAFIENCSISCLDEGKQYTVDYREIMPDGSEEGLKQVRFIANRLVRNFTVADANILDHYTKYCGIIFVGASTQDIADKWEITRPTNGLIRNCRITDASHGYGLCQLHAADNILFTNIRAKGGVTLRLEGHAGQNVGTKDIYGKDIYNEYGKAAVMFQPHVTHHGMVTIDGVESKSSAFTILIRAGFIDRAAKNDPTAEVGTFPRGCTIKNIHGIYGRQAQTEAKDAWILDPSERKYVAKSKKDDVYTQTEAPSSAVVFDDTRGGYDIKCTNITSEGYPSHFPKSGIIFTSDLLPRTQKQTTTIAKTIPAYSK